MDRFLFSSRHLPAQSRKPGKESHGGHCRVALKCEKKMGFQKELEGREGSGMGGLRYGTWQRRNVTAVQQPSDPRALPADCVHSSLLYNRLSLLFLVC